MVDVRLHGIGGDPERRNDVGNHAAGVGRFLIDCGVETRACKEERGRKTCRTCAHDRGLDRSRRGWSRPLLQVLRSSLFHGDLLHLPDLHCSFIVHSGAVELALVVADVAGDVGKSVLLVDNRKGLGVAAFSHKSHVVGDVLVNRTGLHAGRDIAVEKRKRVVRLGRVLSAEGALGVICLCGILRESLDCLDIDVLFVPGAAFFHELLSHAGHSCISAWLEHVGGHGDGPDACVEDVLDREYGASAAVGDGKLSCKFRAQAACHRRGNRQKRAARHVLLFSGKDGAVVYVAECVCKFDSETQVLLLCKLDKPVQHRNGIGILKVVLEALAPQSHVREACLVQDSSYLVVSQKRGIELDEGVELLLREHVRADGLDLLRRTAVHG